MNDVYKRAVVLRANAAVNVTGNATFNVTGSQNYSMALNAIINAGNISMNGTGAAMSLQSNTILNATGRVEMDGNINKAGMNAVESQGTNISINADTVQINGSNTNTGSSAGGIALSNLTINASTVNLTSTGSESLTNSTLNAG
ncbi:hypothetical protein YL93_23155, partial [Salmonella enterica subsp. enterica serovar Montevideo]|nr:hypothetical protein [Salmonella enterica subsp. enterica serovar Montevideo]